jgi:ubiquinone/menaquinone biosynthesis C-methylase UbiE
MTRAGPRSGFFDLWSLVYDLPLVQRAVYRPPQDAVVAALRERACRRLLDVGCGTGQLAARLRRELPAIHVVGCDFSIGMLEHARARDDAVAWVRGDAMRLPFRDRTFDVIVSTEAFHWFPDRRRALHEFARVLVPEGRLMLALVNPRFTATGRVAEAASRLLGEPMRWPTRGELRRLLEGAGFRVERQDAIFRLPGMVLLPPVLTVASVAR